MDEIDLLEALRATVVMFRDAIMVGNPAPKVRRIYEAAFSPQPGDFVIESSTLYYPTNQSKIGTLLREVREAIPHADPLPDGKPQTERVFYIRGLDGKEHRWVNASFMRIARDERDTYDMRGESFYRPTIYSMDEIRQARINGDNPTEEARP